MLRSSGFRGRRAARLLANDDEDRLGRFHGIEVDLDLEIPEIHLVRWIILRVAFDRERLVRLVGPKRALAPESQEKGPDHIEADRKSTRLNSSHSQISYAVFCLKKKKKKDQK